MISNLDWVTPGWSAFILNVSRVFQVSLPGRTHPSGGASSVAMAKSPIVLTTGYVTWACSPKLTSVTMPLKAAASL